jgi:hypothetical protein
VSVPPRDLFAAATRQVIEAHDEWDSPHSFQTLHWDGTQLACRTFACIMPDIDPPGYPALMAGIAAEQRVKHPDDPAYGYLLQIESFGLAEPREDAPEAERERFRRARLTRTFHKQPDAIEMAVAWCADIHGRLWSAAKYRKPSGAIEEHFYPPHTPKRPGGRFIDGLLAVAYATGAADYGLPSPRTASSN